MMNRRKLIFLFLAVFITGTFIQTSDADIGTAFTYQGRLTDNNDVADGLYDFQFKLFDSAADGNQINEDVNIHDIDVIDGYFTVELDFGSVFDGNDVWLEIGVRPGELEDPNVYSVLSPRQEVTATPYAIYAASGPGVEAPLILSGSSSGPIISGTNTGSGPGVYGSGGTYGVYGQSTGYAGYFEGDVKVNGYSAGVIFPDGTKQTTAALPPSGGQVPPDFCIMGDTWLSPEGYTYTGTRFLCEGTEVWNEKELMPTARKLLDAAVVNDKIYVIGGSSPSSSYLAKNEEYNSTTNTWATKADMPTARRDLGVAAVGGKVYAIGGYNISHWPCVPKNEEYDPASNTWATKADMLTPRVSPAVVALNGKIYAIGGYDGTSYSVKNEEYDPVADSWTAKADMPTARAGLIVIAVNNKIYAIGGYDGSTQVATNEEYDPVTDSWTKKADMPTARYSLAGTVMGGKIYAIGGYTRDGFSYLATNEEYDPTAGTWQQKLPMNTARSRLSAKVVNDKIYAIGGDNGSDLKTNEQYSATSSAKYYYIHKKD